MTVAMLRALPAGLLLVMIVRQIPTESGGMRIFILGALNISLFWSLLFIKGQQVVERQRHIALVLASRLHCRNRPGKAQAQWQLLLPVDQHIAFARLGVITLSRNDLNIGPGSRDTLEVLQGLPDIRRLSRSPGWPASRSRAGSATAVLSETDVRMRPGTSVRSAASRHSDPGAQPICGW